MFYVLYVVSIDFILKEEDMYGKVGAFMNNSKTQTQNQRSKYTEDWIPVKAIENGMIILDNKMRVTGVKIRPRNIFILEQSVQDNVIIGLKNFYNTKGEIVRGYYLKDLDCKSLLKQGCKWIVALPPHDCSGGKVDYWQIYMFVKSKKVADMFNCEGIRAVYDLKKQEIVNKDKIKWEAKDYKIIRMD